MVVSNTNAGEIAVLQKLIHNSRSIQATRRATSQFDALPNHVPSSSLTFPPLPDLAPHLQAIGLSDRGKSKIIYAFQSACTQLQTLHLAALSKMLANSSAEHGKVLEAYVSESYMQKLVALRKDILGYTKRQHEKLATPSKPYKPSFNHDYVPALEKYFEYNAYPSAADRALMARKSMMTDRQIEVWFQNHRNRARKDGNPLVRLRPSEPLPPDVSFDSLDATMADLFRPESERCMMERQESEDDESDGIAALALSLGLGSSSPAGDVDGEMRTLEPTQQLQQPQTDPLNASAPPFAYPAPYVPQAQSFLDTPRHRPSITFLKPQWNRQPSSTCIYAPLARRDIDHFTELFARLTVRESVKKQGRRRIAAMPQSGSPTAPQQRWMSAAATCAITTILCPGRHPAFIPSIAPVWTHKTRKSPSPPSQHHLQPCMSSPCAGPSKPSTLMPPTSQSLSQRTQPDAHVSPESSSITIPRRRKSPQLPRRVPVSPPVTQSQRLYASPSRDTSSSSSSSSTRVSSSSSSASSTPRTPSSSTVSLPTSYPTDNTPKSSNIDSSIPSVFSTQDIADIFGDADSAFATPSDQSVSGLSPPAFDSLGFGRMTMASNVFDFNFNTPQAPSIIQAR